MNFFQRLFSGKPRIKKTDIPLRFDLISRVGQGSMSKVWRARDTLTGRMVAVKVLDREKTLRLEARFKGLMRPPEGAIATVLQHPNIVRTLEYGITRDNEQFLVMEFVEGVSLSFLVDMQNDRMKQNRLKYMIQMGEALQYFHQQKFIHRDLCPRNVIVSDEDDTVKLIDFGLAVPNTPPFQAPGNRTGTATYMAPELIKRQRTDQRIDIFSYSVSCYEMYTKRFPWESAYSIEAVMQHIRRPPENIRDHAPDIDEQVAATIMRGLALMPDDRWQTIDEMLRPLREVQRRLEGKTSTRPARDKAPPE
jgi:serine/threonine protein kinase